MPYDLIILNIEINFCSNIFSFFNIINNFVFAYFFFVSFLRLGLYFYLIVLIACVLGNAHFFNMN